MKPSVNLEAGYVLTPTAQDDLVDIRAWYQEEAGLKVARQMVVEFVNAFRLLARNPGLGHSREDLAGSRPVLFWAMRDYLILSRRDAYPLEILGIVRGSRDLPVIIKRREP